MVPGILTLLEQDLARKLMKSGRKKSWFTLDRTDYLLIRDILDRGGLKARIEHEVSGPGGAPLIPSTVNIRLIPTPKSE